MKSTVGSAFIHSAESLHWGSTLPRASSPSFDASTLTSTVEKFPLISKVAAYRLEYRADPKEPTQFGSVSGSDIQNLPISLSDIVSLYRAEQKEPTLFGSASGSDIQNLCIGRNLAHK